MRRLAHAAARTSASWYVRNANGDMVPFSAFSTRPLDLWLAAAERYNGIPSIEIQGCAAPRQELRRGHGTRWRSWSAKLPPGIGYEWTGLSYQEQLSGSQAPALYAISLLFVFLCLAALYESWSIPFAVMLVVPLGIVGAMLRDALRGLANDVYLPGRAADHRRLSAKNAILIVRIRQGQCRTRAWTWSRRPWRRCACVCGRS